MDFQLPEEVTAKLAELDASSKRRSSRSSASTGRMRRSDCRPEASSLEGPNTSLYDEAHRFWQGVPGTGSAMMPLPRGLVVVAT